MVVQEVRYVYEPSYKFYIFFTILTAVIVSVKVDLHTPVQNTVGVSLQVNASSGGEPQKLYHHNDSRETITIKNEISLLHSGILINIIQEIFLHLREEHHFPEFLPANTIKLLSTNEIDGYSGISSAGLFPHHVGVRCGPPMVIMLAQPRNPRHCATVTNYMLYVYPVTTIEILGPPTQVLYDMLEMYAAARFYKNNITIKISSHHGDYNMSRLTNLKKYGVDISSGDCTDYHYVNSYTCRGGCTIVCSDVLKLK